VPKTKKKAKENKIKNKLASTPVKFRKKNAR
jgi:hypothetical protein